MNRPTALLGAARAHARSLAAVALTSLALSPTVEGGPWYGVTLGLILVIAGTGSALRASSWPAWLVVTLQAVVAICRPDRGVRRRRGWVGFSAGRRRLAHLRRPRRAGVRGDRAGGRAGHRSPRASASCVVSGVVLVAWGVDVARRHAASGRPWPASPCSSSTSCPPPSCPMAFPGRSSWPPASAGCCCCSPTAGSELTRWGRPVRGSASRLQSVGGTGRRLGAAALAIAVVVPVVLPSLDEGRFGGNPTGEGGGPGSGEVAAGTQRVITVNPIVDLQAQPHPRPRTWRCCGTPPTPPPPRTCASPPSTSSTGRRGRWRRCRRRRSSRPLEGFRRRLVSTPTTVGEHSR